MNDAEIANRLAGMPGWERAGNKIRREYLFSDFICAFGWMTLVAMGAEKHDHHPEWKNVYNRVEVELTSHDAGGITDRDFRLAAAMDRCFALFPDKKQA